MGQGLIWLFSVNEKRGVRMTQEEIRLSESGARKKHWKRWGPYLSERAWGTVREDYSADGDRMGIPASRSRPFACLPLE